MASSDDDFSLLRQNHRHHNHHVAAALNQAFAHRFPTKATPIHAPPPPPPSKPVVVPITAAVTGGSPAMIGEAVAGDNEDDFAFCSPADPKCTPSFHDSDSNPFDEQPDPNRSIEKRNDREELSDGGTPHSYKKAKTAGGGGDYRKDREEWSDSAIECLVDAYIEKFLQLNRGNLRGRDWEEVASMVSERCEKQTKSVEQCKNKVDNLKKRYKLERHRLINGGVSASLWPWFNKMEQIIGDSIPVKAVDDDKSAGGSVNSLRQSKRYGTATPSPGVQINIAKSKSLTNPRWRRVVFKISGASLACTGPHNIDPKVAMLIAREVSTACRLGVEVAIIVGGRNFFCGDTWVTATGLDRCTAYQIGMMATVMNSILLQSALEKMGVRHVYKPCFLCQRLPNRTVRNGQSGILKREEL